MHKKTALIRAVYSDLAPIGLFHDLHQSLWCLMVVVFNAVFVADHLAIELVDQVIHCGIQIFVGAFGKHVGAFDMDVAFCALTAIFFFLFFDREQNFDIHTLVKVPRYSIKLAGNVRTECRGNFQVMAADR